MATPAGGGVVEFLVVVKDRPLSICEFLPFGDLREEQATSQRPISEGAAREVVQGLLVDNDVHPSRIAPEYKPVDADLFVFLRIGKYVSSRRGRRMGYANTSTQMSSRSLPAVPTTANAERNQQSPRAP